MDQNNLFGEEFDIREDKDDIFAFGQENLNEFHDRERKEEFKDYNEDEDIIKSDDEQVQDYSLQQEIIDKPMNNKDEEINIIIEEDYTQTPKLHLKDERELVMDLNKLLGSIDTILSLDFSIFENYNYQEKQDRVENTLELITRINLFFDANAELLSELVEMPRFPVSTVGLTSAGKDVSSAQLLGNQNLAISDVGMCTTANVNTFVTPSTPGDEDEKYVVLFEGVKKQFSSGEEYSLNMRDLMKRIKESNVENFTTKPIIVHYSGPKVRYSSYNLNTIGLIPRSQGGDPIFQMINKQLNDNARTGGIIIICANIMDPLDQSTAWMDFDVIKQWIKNPNSCKFKVILALTKSDTLIKNHFAKDKTMRDMYNTIFARFEKVMPKTPIFAITGWIAEDGSDENDLAEKHQSIINSVMTRIEAQNMSEKSSKYKKMILEKIGIDNLRKFYFDTVVEQCNTYLSAIKTSLKSALDKVKPIFCQTS